MGLSVDLKIGMGRFAVHSDTESCWVSYKYVQGGEVAFRFDLHGELSALMDAVWVVEEVIQLVGTVWSDDEGVVHVTKPVEGLLGGQVKDRHLKVHHIENWL
jgi:hypothetical protein